MQSQEQLPGYRLVSDKGRQIWQLPDLKAGQSASFPPFDNTNPNSADLVYRAIRNKRIEVMNVRSGSVSSALHKAIECYTQLQAEDGHLPGDYGGPLFLLPGLVIASHVTETTLPETHRLLIARYFLNHQREDGGWGLHIEGQSTMFGTVLQYVALRILGYSGDTPELKKARTWILAHGGAVAIPSWGKFYLAVLGVYEWDGCHSLFPEMWIFPEWLPFHPSRYWCHARMVYLPMAYCYGHRVTAQQTPLTEELRNELYPVPYSSINWKKARNSCAATDRYTQTSPLLYGLNFFTNTYEKIALTSTRRKALKFILDYIQAEDEQTNYINLGPVNKVLNAICIYHAYGKHSPEFQQHYARWFDYLWIAEDGMKMNGYNGSQLWDTAFAVQAVTENGLQSAFPEFVDKAYDFIDKTQVQQEVKEHRKYYRHDSVGGWPFSTLEHGWPITDCTAEGLKVMLHDPKKRLSDKRLQQAADLLLSFQNKDGGWASYEKTRGPKWLELLNPSEIFGHIMIDYSYTECSSASLQGLVRFSRQFPDYRTKEISAAVKRGAAFLQQQQRQDGSWYGSWAVCFTYGTWFGVEGLLAAGFQPYSAAEGVAPEIKAACEFLVSKQNKDGGWGESFDSCLQKRYVAHPQSQVVHTAWAVLTLLAADYPEREVIVRGISYLLNMQMKDGDFPQQSICGVFNHTCGISYTAYRNVFPIWALSRFEKKFPGLTIL